MLKRNLSCNNTAIFILRDRRVGLLIVQHDRRVLSTPHHEARWERTLGGRSGSDDFLGGMRTPRVGRKRVERRAGRRWAVRRWAHVDSHRIQSLWRQVRFEMHRLLYIHPECSK